MLEVGMANVSFRYLIVMTSKRWLPIEALDIDRSVSVSTNENGQNK